MSPVNPIIREGESNSWSMKVMLDRCVDYLSKAQRMLEPSRDATPERVAQALKLVEYILSEMWDEAAVRECLLAVKSKLVDAMEGSTAFTRLVAVFNGMGMVRPDHMARLALVDATVIAIRECTGRITVLTRQSEGGDTRASA